MKAIVEDLKDNGMVSDNCADVLCSTFSGVTNGIINRIIKNKASGKNSRAECDPVIKAFVLTLQFYSAKAYDCVRETFDLALPSPPQFVNGTVPSTDSLVLLLLFLKL